LGQRLKVTMPKSRSTSPPSSLVNRVTLSDLNTRDVLLLSQLSEEHGIENYHKIYKLFTSHPAFKLSHNRLHSTQLDLSEDDIKRLVNELIAKHHDLKIVSICEHYYNLRIEELMAEISDTKAEFDQIKFSMAT